MTEAQKITLDFGEMNYRVARVKMHCISASPETEITPNNTDVFDAVTTQVNKNDITLPAAAVAAFEVTLNTLS